MLDNVGNGRHKTGCFMLCMHTAQMYINIYYSFLLTGSHIFIICASKTLGGRCLLVPISATIVHHRLHVCWYLITLLRLETVYLLRRDLVCGGSEVNLLIHIHAGNHEEDAGAPRSPRQQPAQPEDDRPLVLLKWDWIIKVSRLVKHILISWSASSCSETLLSKIQGNWILVLGHLNL